MKITKDKTIREVKDLFSFKFPGLKMEFYEKKNEAYKGSEVANQFDENLKIAEINPNITSGEIVFRNENTTRDIEQSFEDLFGLHVQVFRRSNELWLQTSATDDWTLEVQNRKGIHSTQSSINS